MEPRKALEALLLGDREYLRLFKQCCMSSVCRLRSQAWQFRDELHDRGHEHSLEDIEDALWELTRDLLPESPAAKWDTEWAGELASKALQHLAE